MQGTRVRALVWEDPTCRGATRPVSTTTEPARLEPVLRNKRGRDSERPMHRDEEWPPLATTRESPSTETKTQHSNQSINQSIFKKKKLNCRASLLWALLLSYSEVLTLGTRV